MEAVALDWEKIGIKVKRVPEATSSFGPKGRAAEDRQDVLGLRLAALRRAGGRMGARAHAKCAFNLLLDGAYDEEIDAAVREIDADKRAKLTHDVGQKLYDGYHGVMLGMKSIDVGGVEEGRRLADARPTRRPRPTTNTSHQPAEAPEAA